MLAIVLSFLIACDVGFGAPFSVPVNSSVNALELRDVIQFVTNYRSTPEIIWTCLITTFLCTWVSMHPNVVGYNFTRWQRLRKQIKMFLIAFSAPEIPLLSALQSWMLANYIADKIGKREAFLPRFKKKMNNLVVTIFREWLAKKMGCECIVEQDGWETVHGHFLLMGGVIFSVDGQLQYLDPQKLLNDKEQSGLYIAARTALKDLPSKNMEIFDRSKGDMVTKSLTLLQTTWFIVTLGARRVQNLNVTALEILTLAYAVMNLFIYIFWWDKPLNVHSPIVFTLTLLEEKHDAPEPRALHSEELEDQPVLQSSQVTVLNEEAASQAASAKPELAANGFIPYEYRTEPTPLMKRIGLFVVLVVFGISGAIYYIAWDFTFPLPIGKTLWRVFCALMTLAPFASVVGALVLFLIAFVLLLIVSCVSCSSRLFKREMEKKVLHKAIGIIVFIVFYTVCRLMLVSLALWSLHDLPPDAHETVAWARFVPHF